MSDFFGAVSEGISKVAKSAGRELERVGKEVVEHVEEDFDSIASAIDNHGFVGGAIQAADVFSPGHGVANALDALNVIPEDPALKELISGGTNLLWGGPVALLAAKDLADAIGAIQASNPGAPSAPMAPSLGAEHPTQAPPARRGWPTEADLVYGGGRTDGCTAGNPSGHDSDIHGSTVLAPSTMHERLREALERLRRNADRSRDGTGATDGQLERDIAKILANPNLMFEDMIFMLMRAFIKDTRREVTGIADDLKGTRKSEHADVKTRQAELDGARQALADAQASKDPGAIQAASNRVQSLKEQMDMTAAERSEARADKFEELKQVMQRLSEMEQALSNVLNTMHEGSMAAIRNIR